MGTEGSARLQPLLAIASDCGERDAVCLLRFLVYITRELRLKGFEEAARHVEHAILAVAMPAE